MYGAWATGHLNLYGEKGDAVMHRQIILIQKTHRYNVCLFYNI